MARAAGRGKVKGRAATGTAGATGGGSANLAKLMKSSLQRKNKTAATQTKAATEKATAVITGKVGGIEQQAQQGQ